MCNVQCAMCNVQCVSSYAKNRSELCQLLLLSVARNEHVIILRCTCLGLQLKAFVDLYGKPKGQGVVTFKS